MPTVFYYVYYVYKSMFVVICDQGRLQGVRLGGGGGDSETFFSDFKNGSPPKKIIIMG